MDEKSEFIKTWNKAWNFLYRLTPAMLTSLIIFSFASGFLTWYGITYLNLAETSMLLKPLFSSLGTWFVFAYDLLMSLVFLGYYLLTKELFLRSKKPSLKTLSRLLCTIPIMIFYILTILNFLNDFGFVFNIIMIQNIFQKLGFESIKKILGGFLAYKNPTGFSISKILGGN
jgi:Fe2+ transport system protein B